MRKNEVGRRSRRGYPSNAQPQGACLPPLNPLSVTLGVTNASFVAQTADWVPAHLFATLRAASRHRGFSFVRVLQRCPQYTVEIFHQAVRDPSKVELLVHPDGIVVPELDQLYQRKTRHDPSDLDTARRLAADEGVFRLGLFYRNPTLPRYEETRRPPAIAADQRVALLNAELDRYAL